MSTLLNGREVANSLLEELRGEVEALKAKGILPKLVVLVASQDPASAVYVRHKEKACAKVGIISEKLDYPADVSEEEILKKIEELNNDESVNGMIVQLPLPDHIDAGKVIKAINPYKDVDGFHAYNVGKMMLSKDFEDLAPCTPKGITKILDHYDVDIKGMEAVVIGRSNIVGKPIANMLLNRSATVTICHRHTRDVASHSRDADLVVVAVGIPKFLKADMVKEGAIIIDVGINRLEDGSLCGDADFDAMKDKVGMITPVPRGVGPMTVACLLMNTVTAAKKQATL